MWFGDCKAAENLKNLSLCVKEGNTIRNVNSHWDFRKETIVFVSNLVMFGEDEMFEIQSGDMVRYKKVYEKLI